MSFIEKARVQFRDSNLVNSAREYLSSRDNRTKIVLFVLVAFVAMGMFFRRVCCSGPNLDGSRVQRSGSGTASSVLGSTSRRTSAAAGIDRTTTQASRINIPIPSAVLNAFEEYEGTHLQRCLQGFYISRIATDGTHYQQSCHVDDDGRMLSERAGPTSVPRGVGSILDMKEVYRLVGQQNPSYMIHEEVRKFGVQNDATHYQRGPEGSFYVCCKDNRGNPLRYRIGFLGQEFGMFPGAETILAKPGQPYNYSALDGVGPVLTAEQVYLRYGRPTLPATSSSSSTNTIGFGSWLEDELILTSIGVKSKTSSQNVPIPQAVLNVGFSINATHYQRASEEYCLEKGVNPIFFVWYTNEGHDTRSRIEMDQNGNPIHQGLFQTAFVLPTSVSIEDNVFNQQVSTGPLLTAEEAYNTYGQPTPPMSTSVQTTSSTDLNESTWHIPQAVINFGRRNNATHYQIAPGGDFYVIFPPKDECPPLRFTVDQSANRSGRGMGIESMRYPYNFSAPDAVGPLLTAVEAYNTYGQPELPVLPESLVPPLHVTETPPEGDSLSNSAMEPGSSSSSTAPSVGPIMNAEDVYVYPNDGSIPPVIVSIGKGMNALGFQYWPEGCVSIVTEDLAKEELVEVHRFNLHGKLLFSYHPSFVKNYLDYRSIKHISGTVIDATVVYSKHELISGGETNAPTVEYNTIPDAVIQSSPQATHFQAAPSGQHYYVYYIHRTGSPSVQYVDHTGQSVGKQYYMSSDISENLSQLSLPGYPLISIEEARQKNAQENPATSGSNLRLYYEVTARPNYTKANPEFFGGVSSSSASSVPIISSGPQVLPEVQAHAIDNHGADQGDQGSTPSSSSSSSSTSGPARRLITKEWIEQQKAIKISGRKSIEGRLPKNYDEATEIIKEERASRAPTGPQSQAWIDLKAGIVNRKPQKLVKQASVSLLPTSSSSSSSDQGPGSI